MRKSIIKLENIQLTRYLIYLF